MYTSRSVDQTSGLVDAQSQQKFYSALADFDSWGARSEVFIKDGMYVILGDLENSLSSAGQAILAGDLNRYPVLRQAAIKIEVDLEMFIREDLIEIQKSGKLW